MRRMADRDAKQQAIQETIRSMMERVLENVLEENPFDEQAFAAQKPLYAALVPVEIFKGSYFERRFVTPFGKVWERLAEVVARTALGRAEQGHRVAGYVSSGRLQRIADHLRELEFARPG